MAELQGKEPKVRKLVDPRDFVDMDRGGGYPFGPFREDVSDGALAAATFAKNLFLYMHGDFDPDGTGRFEHVREKQLTLANKAEISQGVLSRILSGATYPDIVTIAKLEEYIGWDLWGTREQRYNLKHGFLR